MRVLQKVQTAAADRSRHVPHPRLYRVEPRGSDLVDKVFRWGLFGWLMWVIWAPVGLALLVVVLALLG